MIVIRAAVAAILVLALAPAVSSAQPASVAAADHL
jgi:hypothetical protein